MKTENIINVLKEHNLLKEYNVKNDCFSYVTYNSKEVKDNTLFICKGFNFKEEYLINAYKSGASIYVSEIKYNIDMDYIIVSDIRKAMSLIGQVFYKLSSPLTKIGITGTKGKTTTVFFIHNILNAYRNKKTGYLSTIDYYTGKSTGTSVNTTPESLDLCRYFKEIEESSFNEVVMEVSSQAEKLDRIYNQKFSYGAFLNIGLDHISSHEHSDFDDYLNCKIEFLKKCETVFVYKETDYYNRIISSLENKNIITFGFDKSCNYVISDIKTINDETVFKVNNMEYKLKIKGDFNCINATCAIAMASNIGISYETIYEGLYNTTVPGRMEYISSFKCPIIIDYAHNKLSIETLINAVKSEYKDKKLKLVMGLPGDKAFNRRHEVAEVFPFFSKVYLTMDHPGSESVIDICNEVVSYVKCDTPYKIIEDRAIAIKSAMDEASSGDVLLILGKGNEDYQVINGKNVYYGGDKKVVLDIMEENYGKCKN